MTKIEEIEQKLNEMNEGLEVGIKKFQEQITDFNNELRIAKEDFLDELNECQKALAELKESKKEGKWKPAQDDEYWYRVSTNGAIVRDYYDENSIAHLWKINHNIIFPTKEECEKYWHFMDAVKEKSYEFSEEEWKDVSIDKYCINLDTFRNKLDVDCYDYTKYLGMVYFKTEEDAQYIIDNFKEELLKYWL